MKRGDESAQAHVDAGDALRRSGRLEGAVGCYREALRIDPSLVQAWHNLGNALLGLGRFGEAATSYQQVLEIKPDLPQAHSNLGNALLGLGRAEEAAASYRRALALNPGLAAAHSNLSDALRDLGQSEDALASCRRALAIEADVAGTHNSLGNALLDLGRLAEATASYARAVSLDPRFAKAYVNLAMALRLQGATADAEAMCRKALELDPSAAAAMVLLAELQGDRGLFEEAEALFTRASELDPDLAEAWAGMAQLRKMTANDSRWLAQAARVAQGSLTPRRESYIRYALGKYFDDVGDYEQAFANYRRANDLTKRLGPQHDPREMSVAVDRIIHACSRDWANKPRRRARPSDRPVFIVGMPRSGTTLAEQILASHPAVFGAGELPYWGDASAAVEAANRRGEDAENLILTLGEEYLRLLDRLSAAARRVVDKMPANFRFLGLILDALPDARVIHLRRDPRDTCLSIFFQHFKAGHTYANDLQDLANHYKEYLRLMDHWRSVLPGQAMLEVPYEGLVADQERWSRRMVEFVGLPWDAACLDFHRTERRVITASKWQVRQRISAASVGRWRNYRKHLGPLGELAEPPPV